MSNKLFQKAAYAGIGFTCAYIECWFSMEKLKKRAFKDGYYCGFSHCKSNIRSDVKTMIKIISDMTWSDEDLIINTIDELDVNICWTHK
jgi:hypothetical protein